jgi:hypothetical protein
MWVTNFITSAQRAHWKIEKKDGKKSIHVIKRFSITNSLVLKISLLKFVQKQLR